MRRPKSCGACGVAGHTIRKCPNKLAQAKELGFRLSQYLPALREGYPHWVWKDIALLLAAIEGVKSHG